MMSFLTKHQYLTRVCAVWRKSNTETALKPQPPDLWLKTNHSFDSPETFPLRFPWSKWNRHHQMVPTASFNDRSSVATEQSDGGAARSKGAVKALGLSFEIKQVIHFGARANRVIRKISFCQPIPGAVISSQRIGVKAAGAKRSEMFSDWYRHTAAQVLTCTVFLRHYSHYSLAAARSVGDWVERQRVLGSSPNTDKTWDVFW